MLFDGKKFRKSSRHAIMPVKLDGKIQPYVDPARQNYVVFGKIVASPKSDAHYTGLTNRSDGSAVFAEIVEVTGHPLTNMAYGMDSRIYLAYDGKVYIATR